MTQVLVSVAALAMAFALAPGLPLQAAPVALTCSCLPEAGSPLSTAPAAEAPLVCLLISAPDGGACRSVAAHEIDAESHRALFKALFPHLAARSAAPAQADLGVVGDLVADRVHALLGESGAEPARAFRTRLPARPETIRPCLARAQGQFIEGSLTLDLPPYTMRMQDGLGCHHAQFGGTLTFAVTEDGVLYRFMLALTWPEGF